MNMTAGERNSFFPQTRTAAILRETACGVEFSIKEDHKREHKGKGDGKGDRFIFYNALDGQASYVQPAAR